MLTFPRDSEIWWVGFGHSMDCGCLSSFRRIGCKLLLVMVREKAEQRIVESEVSSEGKKGKIQHRNDGVKGGLLSLLLN